MDESREEKIARAHDYMLKAQIEADDAETIAQLARDRGGAAIERGDGLDAAAWLAEFTVQITRRDAFLNLVSAIRQTILVDEDEDEDAFPEYDPDEGRYLN